MEVVEVVVSQGGIEQILDGTSLHGWDGQHARCEDGYLHLSWAV
jgi:hypothetical protein